MKIMFFGATGDMGKRVVEEICDHPRIKLITIVGRNRKGYEKLVKRMYQKRKKSYKLRFVNVNLDNCLNLPEVIGESNIVANAAGPFYRYEEMLMRASMKAGAHYVSLCDDHDAAEKVLKLDEEAKKRRVTAITGMGWTPGLSSLLARSGVDLLDETKRIYVYWAGNTENKMGLAVILHVLNSFTGKVPSLRGGEMKMVPAGSEREVVNFPEPLGDIAVYNVGHPEPVTMPLNFPDASEIVLKGGINEDLFNSLSILVNRLGLSKLSFLRDLTALFFQKTLPLWRRIARLGPEVSGIRVDVEGFFNKKECRLSYKVAGPMDVLTGLPMAFALKMIAEGRLDRYGVFAPESKNLFDTSVMEMMEAKRIYIEKEKHFI